MVKILKGTCFQTSNNCKPVASNNGKLLKGCTCNSVDQSEIISSCQKSEIINYFQYVIQSWQS